MTKSHEHQADSGSQRPRLNPLPLGPFDLFELMGEGAMGQVWRGHHRDQDFPVAIKMVTEPRACSHAYHRQFRREVRSVACLSHPCIVDIFDYGKVPAKIEEATYGSVVAGSPYFVMELCAQGSLADHPRPTSWRELSSLLLSLLDALAHAHARRVVHRDIKPANVLLSGTSMGWQDIKLADFGLSYFMDWLDEGTTGPGNACGTPAYAAPEQLLGRERDIGPWSDLYGLGCLAWELACGHPPFRGQSIIEIGRRHLHSPLPALEPSFDVPDGFEAWLHQMLQKDMWTRCRSAADAAWTLMLLADQDPEASHLSEPSSAQASGVGARGSEFDAAGSIHSTPLIFESLAHHHHRSSRDGDVYQTYDDERGSYRSSPERSSAQLALDLTSPPIPAHWSDWSEPRSSLHLHGAGLHLYGLRRIPLYGRYAERDRLWDSLVRVARGESPVQMVLVEGPAGTGKSHLARWLCERAAEVGAAHPLMAAHNPGNGGDDGLVRMLQTYFRCTDMDADQLVERLDAWFDRHEVDDPHQPRALAELISPALRAKRSDKSPLDAPARCKLITKVLEYIGRERPIILWLDDLQWSSETMIFVRSLLESPDPSSLSVLIVGTCRTDAPSEDPQAIELLDDIADNDKLARVELGPLSIDTHTQMIEQLLHLEPTLARSVADRTAGNPLFAVQLIGDWIDRGVLEVSDKGFSLREGGELIVPDDLFSMWMSRLNRVLEDKPETIWPALELAAALGVQWLESEWQGCCAVSGIEVRESDIEALLSQRLIETTDAGYAFAHSILRETLERHAREHGRWVGHNRSCARMLVEHRQDLLGPNRRDGATAERLGRYYIEGEQWRESLDPLLEAIKWRGNRRQSQIVEFLLDLRAEAIERLGSSAEARSRLQNTMMRALTYAHRHEYERAIELGERNVEAARDSGDVELLARALFRLGQIHHLNGEISEARELSEQAFELIDQCVDPPDDHDVFVRGVVFALGELELRRGHAHSALAHFRRLSEGLDTSQSDHDRATNLRMIGNCQRALGDFDSAREAISQAADLYEKLGNLDHLAGCLSLLGDVYRQAGQLDEAEPYYRRALTASREGRRRNYLTAVLNLGLLEVEQRRFESACARLGSLLEQPEVQGSPFLMVVTRCTLLPCLATRDEFDRLDRVFAAVCEVVEEHKMRDVDLAIPAEIAAEIAREAGQDDRAEALERFAHLQRGKDGES